MVREAYGAIARGKQRGGCCAADDGTSCCGPAGSSSTRLGYSEAELAAVPEGADLGLGCGNPHVVAALKPGQRVLDLGSGSGFDALLAARQVGPTGGVIGVDMTPGMVALARRNAAKARAGRVDFRLGLIERLPVDDASIDVIISNCVINLSPDKAAVFREAYRVLVPGGRIAIADMVAVADRPAAIADDPAGYAGCVTGAAPVADLERMIADVGFQDVRITVRTENPAFEWTPRAGADPVAASALIEAVKPCCESTLFDACCQAADKLSCCGPSHPPSTCGCQPDAGTHEAVAS